MIYETPDDWLATPHRRVALFGMSGLGKTRIAAMLREEADWFHYSVDFRIGTRYMGEHIVDNFKREAMRNPFLRSLLRSDSIYIASNITFHNLEPLSTYLGKPGDPAKGGIPFDEYLRRQRQHRDAEIAATRDALPFIAKAEEIYGYGHFVCDTSGSLCEVVDPLDTADPVLCDLARATLPVWFRGTEADFEALATRFDKAPKPMYYPEDFLTELWSGYLAAEGVAPDQVDPDAFIRHGFRALMAHRLPRYAAMAARWGVTVEAADVAEVRDPADFDALIAEAIARSPAMTHDHGAHGHAHGHHHHAHAANARAVGIAALLTGGFLVAEVIGGLLAGSLALLADAGHMLTDLAALAMAWLAFRVARRPADATRTYGFDRLSVLAAFVNGLALFAIAAWIVLEAARRLGDPQPVAGGIMLTVATLGLLVNLASLWVLSRADHSSLNLRAAFLHVAGDLLGSVGAIVAALVILWIGWTPIDPLLSVLVSLLILRSAWTVVRESGHILLEATPPDFDARAVAADLTAQVPDVAEVRHLHAWSISEARPMVTLEAVIGPEGDPEAARRRIKARLAERFGIGHATVEVLSATEAQEGQLPAAGCSPI